MDLIETVLKAYKDETSMDTKVSLLVGGGVFIALSSFRTITDNK